VQAIVARVLTERVQPARLRRESVPAHVDAALSCALAKLPADRFPTAGEFARALTDPHAVLPQRAEVDRDAGSKSPWHRRPAAMLSLGAVLGAAAIVGLTFLRRNTDPAPYPSLVPLALTDVPINPPSPAGTSLALSRDGSMLAIAGNAGRGNAIMLRRLDGLALEMIRGAEYGRNPSFAPDGRSLLFIGGVAGGPGSTRLMTVPVTGGTPRLLADSAHNASWGDDDHVVFAYRGRLFRVPASGGAPVPIPATDTSAGPRTTPFVLPGSKAALIAVYPPGEPRLENAGLAVVDLRSGAVRELGIPGANPRYVTGRAGSVTGT
jgi:hypothetical protein